MRHTSIEIPILDINRDKYTSPIGLPAISKILDKDVKLLVGAHRLLLLPLLTSRAEADCGELRKFCYGEGKLAANYWVGDMVAVVEAQLGSLRRGQNPCAVDRRRMPPLARYEEYGLVRIAEGRVYVDVGKLLGYPLFRAAKKVVDSLGICGVRSWREAPRLRPRLSSSTRPTTTSRRRAPGRTSTRRLWRL